MPLLLLIVGAVLVLAGLASIAAGAPDWVLGLSLGATLIQSGTIAFVGGLIMIALGLVLIVLQDLLKRFDAAAAGIARAPVAAIEARSPARPPRPPQPAPETATRRDPFPEIAPGGPEDEPEDDGEPLRPRRERPRDANADEAERPRRQPPAVPSEDRPRPRREAAAPAFADEDALCPRPDRASDRTPARRDEPPAPRRDPGPIPPVSQPFATEPRRRPPESAQEPAEPYAPKFRPAPEPVSPVPAAPAAASDTVVRSGVIGGMAYTLYADGSIEAELGIGTVRFASIADLQDHVTRTGTEPDADFDGTRR